jgi:hypothetical protein
VLVLLGLVNYAYASTIYLDGLSPPLPGSFEVGDHLVSPQPKPSVGGTPSNGISNDADMLNGLRTYTYDTSAQPDLTDGIANRGDAGFAMLIWEFSEPKDTLRLYTHQDHIFDSPNTGPLGIITNFVAQDVMEYSVWGSEDGDDFVLLSDVTDFDIDGDGVGKPTYTFAGTEPTIIYRGGSTENGVVNAYTRDYTFDQPYKFFGIRTSQVSLTIPGGGVDADPEIDAIIAFNVGEEVDDDGDGYVEGQDPDDNDPCVPDPLSIACVGSPVGGELIPIDTTVLLLAGAQSSMWLLPFMLSIIGVGVFVVFRKSQNY